MGEKKKTTIIHKVLDGEASKSETRILKRSLAEDPATKAEYEGLKRVSEISKKVPEPAPDPDFKKRVLKGIQQNPPPKA